MTDYFIENEDSVYFLYYYPNSANVTTNKGFVSEQYPNEYKYDYHGLYRRWCGNRWSG